MRTKKTLALGMSFAMALGAAAIAGPVAAQDEPLEQVTFQLNWVPGGFHAGFALAREAGYYEDEGLFVHLVPGNGSATTAQLAAAGNVNLGNADAAPVTPRVATAAPKKVIATLNTIWDVKEDRGFLKLRGMAVGLTVGAIAFVGGAGFLLAALPATLDKAGLGDAARWSLNIARFPLLLVVMAVGLSVLYWAGPNRQGPLKLLTWGATIATILWLVLSGLFSFYTASFASYNETYGSLGAIVIMLLWLFITAFVVLVGAEIDAERESLDTRG